jgi:hypothetical protein
MFVTVLAASTSADVLYGISKGFGTAVSQVYEMNPLTAQISNAMPVTLPGFTVSRSLALAANPLNGTLWCVIQTSDSVRRLATIVPSTGVATQVGPLANQISTLAFKSDGTLLGVSGDGGSPAETLYQISTLDASLTVLFALGNGDDGETIAIHPSGLMYHSSGNNTALFESVDLGSQAVTPLGSANGEAFAMGYSAAFGQMFLSDINLNLYTVNLANGARTLVGFINSVSDNRGLAFVVPTLITLFCFGDGSGTACPCGNSGAPGNGCAHSLNANGANLAGSGNASISSDSFVLSGSGMPDSSALYFQGTAQINGGLGTAFGDGLRCAGGSVIRLGTKTNAGGASQYPTGADPTIAVKGMNAAGDVRMYQVWYRNAAAFCTASTFNLTNGLQVTWSP